MLVGDELADALQLPASSWIHRVSLRFSLPILIFLLEHLPTAFVLRHVALGSHHQTRQALVETYHGRPEKPQLESDPAQPQPQPHVAADVDAQKIKGSVPQKNAPPLVVPIEAWWRTTFRARRRLASSRKTQLKQSGLRTQEDVKRAITAATWRTRWSWLMFLLRLYAIVVLVRVWQRRRALMRWAGSVVRSHILKL